MGKPHLAVSAKYTLFYEMFYVSIEVEICEILRIF